MSKWSLTSSALAAALLLAGCGTLEPPVPTAQPQIPAAWPEATEGETTTARLDWRGFFADPALETVIEQALANNRDLRVAVLNVERARALYRIQRADRVPSVGAAGTLTRTGGDSAPEVETYGAEVGLASFELDLFGRVRSLSDAALQQYFATEEARRSAQLTLVAEVANAWLMLAADQELLGIAEATLENFEEALELTQRRQDLGAASALEVSQARTSVANARADVALFAGQVAQDRNALALLVGAPVEAAWLPEAFVPEVMGIAPAPAGLPSKTLLRRPDIVRAEHELLAANANIGAARAAFFPSISLTASAGTASSELSGLFGAGTGVWSFLPRIDVPVFQGGRLRANRDAAIAERDIALALYERSIQAGFRETADALTLSWTLHDRRAALEEMVAAAARTEEISEERYRAGQVDYLTLLDAQRTLYGARQMLVQTQLREQANRVELYRALGGGWNRRT
ncbi:MAG: efflux transporter outer membrane subunit [Opitutales bacterium]